MHGGFHSGQRAKSVQRSQAACAVAGATTVAETLIAAGRQPEGRPPRAQQRLHRGLADQEIALARLERGEARLHRVPHAVDGPRERVLGAARGEGEDLDRRSDAQCGHDRAAADGAPPEEFPRRCCRSSS